MNIMVVVHEKAPELQSSENNNIVIYQKKEAISSRHILGEIELEFSSEGENVRDLKIDCFWLRRYLPLIVTVINS